MGGKQRKEFIVVNHLGTKSKEMKITPSPTTTNERGTAIFKISEFSEKIKL